MTNKIKLSIVIGIFVVIFIALTIVSIINKSNSSGSNGAGNVNQNSYVDPSSGVTVLSPDGKAKEPAERSLLILGMSKLLDSGFSYQQLGNLNSFLTNYSTSKTIGSSEKITQISLVVASIRQVVDPTNSEVTILSDIMINRKYPQKIVIKYHNTYDFILEIRDTSNNLISSYPQGD